MDKEKWRLTEELVVLIEKHISSDSIIEYDQKLTDLSGDSSGGRQCDVVIRTGKPPRETLTIVEVQDRGTPFNITTFDGLYDKMRKVGAQHLICVSRQEFPESIKKAALRHGPTIRLVTLKNIEAGDFPINFWDNTIVCEHRGIINIGTVAHGVKKGEIPMQKPSSSSSKDEIYLLGEEKASIAELLFQYIDRNKLLLTPGLNEVAVSVPFDDRCLSFVSSDKLIQVKVDFSATVEFAYYRLPLKYMSYNQQDWNHPLAWIAEAKGTVNGNEVTIKGLVKPTGDGNYGFNVMEISPGYKLKVTTAI